MLSNKAINAAREYVRTGNGDYFRLFWFYSDCDAPEKCRTLRMRLLAAYERKVERDMLIVLGVEVFSAACLLY